MRFGFVGSHFVSESPKANNAALFNWYPEIDESGSARNSILLYPSPGYRRFSTDNAVGPVRGMIDVGSRAFVLIRSTFYEISASGGLTAKGTVSSTTGPVSMAANENYILIVAGGHGYTYDLAATFGLIASVNFPASPIVAGFSDGYFIVLSSNGYFYLSALDDPLTWAGSIDSERVQAPSNQVVGMVILNRRIWIMGDRLIQPFWNSGNPSFPYEADLSATMNQGLAAQFGANVIPDENTIAWLGHNDAGQGVAYMADGANPVRISDHSFESEVATYSTIADAVGMVFQIKGHVIWSLTFPTAGTTWRYDFTASRLSGRHLWHRAAYWNASTGSYEAHRAMYHIHWLNKHIVGDRGNGKLYEMNIASRAADGTALFCDDDGDVIRRLRRCPHIHNENKTIYYGSLEIILEPGIGLVSGQGSDPQATVRFSNDGGENWSDELWASAGKIGKTQQRVRFDRQGSGRDRVVELVVTDPVAWRIIDAEYNNVTVGLS